MTRLWRMLAWVGVVVGALLPAGLIVLVVVADLDTAGQVAGIVGTIAGLAGLGVSVYALKQQGAASADGERSVVSGDVSGIVSTGDNAMNSLTWAERATVLPPEAFTSMAELAAPQGLVKLPPYPNRFVGRAQLLTRLDEMLESPGGVVVQAVHGLGGIGKSTLAAYWAATHATGRHPIWWITADSPATLDAGLAALATALQPALSDVLSFEALRERAVQWLAAHHGWLVILDNVNDPADISSLLARTRGGRFLITSRRTTGWHDLATSIPMDVLDRAEAVDLLTGVLNRSHACDLDGADDLCRELGCLPLAIEQAGAFITETGSTPRDYLDLLATYPAAMYRHSAEGTDTSRTIARIWHVTLDRLADEPLTGTVLRILAWYAPDNIPRTLLNGLANPPDLTHAIRRLAAYSLLTTHRNTLSVHRLVQAVARTPDPDGPHRTPHAIDHARERAATLLYEALPKDKRDPDSWIQWRRLIPHIDALAEHATPDTDTTITADLFGRTGGFLLRQGPRATRYLQRGLAGARRALGENHPHTLAFRNDVASAYRAAGDLDRAIPLYEAVLADARHALGENHPLTETVHSNLAAAIVERDGGNSRQP
ncbi:tetratricopeptide repeat protein [Streptomyces sp. NPDC002935]|uniref:tetratricopeptide repeat protein n=1 Tax=Streptomyces sp. NPDC002935 TaxID=3154545 RepID=UPI0033B1B871